MARAPKFKPDCKTFPGNPNAEAGWNHEKTALGYCECRSTGRHYLNCHIAIPNDNVLDLSQLKANPGDHWACGESVQKSIPSTAGVVNGGFHCLRAHVSPNPSLTSQVPTGTYVEDQALRKKIEKREKLENNNLHFYRTTLHMYILSC